MNPYAGAGCENLPIRRPIVAAFTATATPELQADIKSILQLGDS